MRVLITDDLAPACLRLLEEAGVEADVQLKKTPEELKALAAGADAWLVRSGTKLTADLIAAAPRLRVIGRAGVGVDNVDLAAATRRGVLVLNAPDGNTVSTAEHTCAMILALARHVPQAHASLAAGAWERKKFGGAELEGKTLGVVGLGKVGRGVAQRMRAFGMRVLAFDPVLAPDAAERLGIEVAPLETIWAEADVITVHTPLNDATRGLLGRETLARCKDGVRIVNVARGGIVDEATLLDALESGKVAGAALDVFSEEPPGEALRTLLAHPHVVVTPHIAASTDEAQEKVAVQVTEDVLRVLEGRPALHPVNGDALRLVAAPEAAAFVALAERLGRIAAQLVDGPVERVVVAGSGEAALFAEGLAVAATAGVLAPSSAEPVNLVNAPLLAREHGLRVEERRRPDDVEHGNLVEVTVEVAGRTRSLRGAVVGKGEGRLPFGNLRFVGLDGFRFEVKPEGHLLFYQNVDRPGMLAAVGGLLAEAGVNIAALALGREGRGALALTVLTTDEPIPGGVVRALSALKGVRDVRVVHVGPDGDGGVATDASGDFNGQALRSALTP